MTRIEINQRIVVNGSKGVIKYYGPVEGTTGIWVGIDWDNEERGKHDGTFQGRRYFRASTSTSGSFVREQHLDFGTELLDQVVEKYASGQGEQTNSDGGLNVEFVKMEKIFQKQKNISKLKCIVLSWSKVSHLRTERLAAEECCFSACTELDLTQTMVAKWTTLVEILSAFPALRILHLSDNRIEPLEECNEQESARLNANLRVFQRITHVSMNRCRLSEQTASNLTKIFTNLEELYLAENGLSSYCPSSSAECRHLRVLDLQGNPLAGMHQLKAVLSMTSLQYLNLSSCQIAIVDFGDSELEQLSQLETLILQNNRINQWASAEQLARLPSLRKLNLKGNPLSGARGVDSREMIVAKVPQIIDLDKCDISPVARRSAELLFLSRFSTPPIDPEHRATIERLKAVYCKDEDDELPKAPSVVAFSSRIHSKRLFLVHQGRQVERTLSMALPIHKVVGLGARLFGFDPDQLEGIELRRFDPNYPPEKFSRTKDNLLRQFDLDDGDSIVFV